MFISINKLRDSFKEKTQEFSKEALETKSYLEQELQRVKDHHEVKLQASTAESTRRKLSIEKQIEERKASLKELAKEEQILLGNIYQAKQQLTDFKDQLSALKAKFS